MSIIITIIIKQIKFGLIFIIHLIFINHFIN